MPEYLLTYYITDFETDSYDNEITDIRADGFFVLYYNKALLPDAIQTFDKIIRIVEDNNFEVIDINPVESSDENYDGFAISFTVF